MDYRLEPPEIHDGPDEGVDHEGAEPDVFNVEDDRAACAAEGAWVLGRDWGASE